MPTPDLDIFRCHVRTLSVNWHSLYTEAIEPPQMSHMHAAVDQCGLRRIGLITHGKFVELLLHLPARVPILDLYPGTVSGRNDDFLSPRS